MSDQKVTPPEPEQKLPATPVIEKEQETMTDDEVKHLLERSENDGGGAQVEQQARVTRVTPHQQDQDPMEVSLRKEREFGG